MSAKKNCSHSISYECSDTTVPQRGKYVDEMTSVSDRGDFGSDELTMTRGAAQPVNSCHYTA